MTVGMFLQMPGRALCRCLIVHDLRKSRKQILAHHLQSHRDEQERNILVCESGLLLELLVQIIQYFSRMDGHVIEFSCLFKSALCLRSVLTHISKKHFSFFH